MSALRPQWIGVFVNADELEKSLNASGGFLYHKSIALMTEACEVAHRAYIFDNSGSKHKLLAKVTDFDSISLETSVINPWLLGTELWRSFS